MVERGAPVRLGRSFVLWPGSIADIPSPVGLMFRMGGTGTGRDVGGEEVWHYFYQFDVQARAHPPKVVARRLLGTLSDFEAPALIVMVPAEGLHRIGILCTLTHFHCKYPREPGF